MWTLTLTRPPKRPASGGWKRTRFEIQNRLLRLVLQDEAFAQTWMRRLIVEELVRLSENNLLALLQVPRQHGGKYKQLLPFIKKLSRADQTFFHLAASDAVFEERIRHFLSRFNSELVAAKLTEVEP